MSVIELQPCWLSGFDFGTAAADRDGERDVRALRGLRRFGSESVSLRRLFGTRERGQMRAKLTSPCGPIECHHPFIFAEGQATA